MSSPAKSSWLIRLSPETEAFYLLQHRLGIRWSEARHLLNIYQREHRLSTRLPVLAAPTAFIAWIIGFGLILVILDDFGFITDSLSDRWPGQLAASLMGYPAAIAFATLVYIMLRRRLLLRPIRRCIDTPACFACDYPLRGVPPANGCTTCPECGIASPAPQSGRVHCSP